MLLVSAGVDDSPDGNRLVDEVAYGMKALERAAHLRSAGKRSRPAAVWNQPYLETCCRAALHRLHLSGALGRPPGLLDQPCLTRLVEMDLCRVGPDGRFTLSPTGQQRHASEVLKIAPVAEVPAAKVPMA
jgi:hypothetical protein